MVMCGVAIEEKDYKKLKELEVKDSKLLTKQQREIIFDKIIGLTKYNLIVVSSKEVDNAVNGLDGLNLNFLEADKTAEIINYFSPSKAIIDLPSRNVKTYRNYLLNKLNNKNIKLVLEHKADMNYEIVSAASIIAKVTRDREIEKIKEEINADFGSGYLTDPKTISFFEKNFEKHSDIFRKSWIPYKQIIYKKFQTSLREF